MLGRSLWQALFLQYELVSYGNFYDCKLVSYDRGRGLRSVDKEIQDKGFEGGTIYLGV